MSQDTIFLRDINGITAEDIKEAEDSYWTIENMNKWFLIFNKVICIVWIPIYYKLNFKI